MNEQILAARDFIQTYGLYIQILSLFAYLYKVREVTAFVCCVITLLIFTIIHYYFEKQLLIMAQQANLQELVSDLWYLGFAYTDAFLVLTVLVTCRKMAWSIDRITRLILFSYVALGLTQIVRYVDRIILGADQLGAIYSIVIPTINISITALIFVAAIFVFIKNKRT